MHQYPEVPRRATRVTRSWSRRTAAVRRAAGHRSGRLAASVCLSTVVTSLVLVMPVVAGSESSTPVVLGQDGGLRSSEAFAGLSSSASFSWATGKSSVAPSIPAVPSIPAPKWPKPPRVTVPELSIPTAPDPRTSAPLVTEPDPAPEAQPEPSPAPEPAPEAQPEPPPAPKPAPAQAPTPMPAPEPAPAPAPAPKPAPAPAPVPARSDGSTEGQVFAMVNAERAAAGCGALSADGGLTSVARAHSEDMRDRGFFDHVNPDRLDPFERADRAGVTARAENIARGQQSAAEVMNSWMASPGHRANILNCSLTRLGVGIAEGSGGPWWTQLFG